METVFRCHQKPDLSEKIYIATISDDGPTVASHHCLGIELDVFCEAAKMDEPNFTEADQLAKMKLSSAPRAIFHAPFAEIYPSAIDPLVVEIAEKRLNQAYRLASGYGIKCMVVHGGFLSNVYFEVWFHARSVEFWKRFMADKPNDFNIYIENVLEEKPDILLDIVSEINDPRIKLCLDLGHAFSQSQISLTQWVDAYAPYLGHVHTHNNNGKWDEHRPLGDGDIPMEEMICYIAERSPNATYTVESLSSEPSVRWLIERGFLPSGNGISPDGEVE